MVTTKKDADTSNGEGKVERKFQTIHAFWVCCALILIIAPNLALQYNKINNFDASLLVVLLLFIAGISIFVTIVHTVWDITGISTKFGKIPAMQIATILSIMAYTILILPLFTSATMKSMLGDETIKLKKGIIEVSQKSVGDMKAETDNLKKGIASIKRETVIQLEKQIRAVMNKAVTELTNKMSSISLSTNKTVQAQQNMTELLQQQGNNTFNNLKQINSNFFTELNKTSIEVNANFKNEINHLLHRIRTTVSGIKCHFKPKFAPPRAFDRAPSTEVVGWVLTNCEIPKLSYSGQPQNVTNDSQQSKFFVPDS